MKQNETDAGMKRRYFAVMVVCFLFGGFSFISFLMQIYTNFWRTEFLGFPIGERAVVRGSDFLGRDSNFPLDFNGPARGPVSSPDPLAALLSPMSLYLLAGAVVSIVAGIVIWNIMREKEIRLIRRETTDSLLLPDEKKVIDALKKADYELTQARLVKETGLGKVQVHRTIKRLESKGVLEKHDYGLTNKIILKKQFFE
ncbi:MAG: hypothetical protein PHH08_02900 [Candidatus ainarchaeum sp.]|nr:hypothetical protein [Candidatus ainarchaeum sp.]